MFFPFRTNTVISNFSGVGHVLYDFRTILQFDLILFKPISVNCQFREVGVSTVTITVYLQLLEKLDYNLTDLLLD